MNDLIRLVCFYLIADNYSLLFPSRGTNDYVIISGIPSLEAVTVCLWINTTDNNNKGTPLSYAVQGQHNELFLYNYNNFQLCVGGSWRYKYTAQKNHFITQRRCYRSTSMSSNIVIILIVTPLEILNA